MNYYQKLLLVSLGSLTLSACFDEVTTSTSTDDNTTTTTVTTEQLAITIGSPSYSSPSTVAMVSTTAPYTATTQLNTQTDSNNTLSSYKNVYYILNQKGGAIAKYLAEDTTKPVWECSVNSSSDTGTNSNPYQVVHVSDSKAYVVRYGNTNFSDGSALGGKKIWVINPGISDSSKCATEFKTGEIDLSAFDSADKPDMSSAVLVGSKLFVTIQNLKGGMTSNGVTTSQVVVINTDTDSVIDVDSSQSGIQAIDLVGFNPTKIIYSAALNKLFVANIGDYASNYGSLDAIDPDTYQVSQVIAPNATIKQVNDVVILDSSKGYIIGGGYDASYNQVNTLYSFDPAGASSQNLSEVNSDLSNQPMNTMALSNGQLWVGINSTLKLLLTDTEQVAATIDTKMKPSKVAFVTKTTN